MEVIYLARLESIHLTGMEGDVLGLYANSGAGKTEGDISVGEDVGPPISPYVSEDLKTGIGKAINCPLKTSSP